MNINRCKDSYLHQLKVYVYFLEQLRATTFVNHMFLFFLQFIELNMCVLKEKERNMQKTNFIYFYRQRNILRAIKL